jgi:predicted TIM-barrel fold metal-dependent hydrolase
MHFYDPAFPNRAPKPMPQNAGVPEYRRLQQRTGTTRVVVVQPRNHGTDNAVTVNAIAEIGAAARGIAVLHPAVTDAELKQLDAGGIRGVRFSLGEPATAIVTPDMIEPLANRIATLGWHVQLHAPGDLYVEHAALLRRLPVPIVFDHMGRLPPAAGLAHPAFPIIRELLDRGRAWVKISGAYLNTRTGPPAYSDATKIARAYVRAAPERLVWGSDWPHPSEKSKPDDALLFDLLAEWAPDETTRNRILVTNPELLYGFA